MHSAESREAGMNLSWLASLALFAFLEGIISYLLRSNGWSAVASAQRRVSVPPFACLRLPLSMQGWRVFTTACA